MVINTSILLFGRSVFHVRFHCVSALPEGVGLCLVIVWTLAVLTRACPVSRVWNLRPGIALMRSPRGILFHVWQQHITFSSCSRAGT